MMISQFHHQVHSKLSVMALIEFLLYLSRLVLVGLLFVNRNYYLYHNGKLLIDHHGCRLYSDISLSETRRTIWILL